MVGVHLVAVHGGLEALVMSITVNMGGLLCFKVYPDLALINEVDTVGEDVVMLPPGIE